MKKKNVVDVIFIGLLIVSLGVFAYLYTNDQEGIRSCYLENDDLRAQIAEIEEEKKTLEKKFNSLSNDYNLLQKDYKWIKGEHDTLKSDYDELENKNENLERELSSCRMSGSY